MNKNHAESLYKYLKKGADFSNLGDALAIRWLAYQHPDFIFCTAPMGQYSVWDRLPYLGAKLTVAGQKNKSAVISCLEIFLNNPQYDRKKWTKQEETQNVR